MPSKRRKFAATLGSADWLKEVFAGPPARDVRGRSRPTQRYMAADDRGEDEVAEGGHLSAARCLLTMAVKAGLINHYKLEPFALNERDHGLEGIPDGLFQTCDDRTFVLEAKSARYLTQEKLAKCRRVEAVINAAGMTYLLWTDAWPLTPKFRQLTLQLRRCGTADVPENNIKAVAEQVRDTPMSFQQLRELGLYREYVLAAVFRGLVHIEMTGPPTDESLVSSLVSARRFDSLLNASVSAHGFWSGLSRN